MMTLEFKAAHEREKAATAFYRKAAQEAGSRGLKSIYSPFRNRGRPYCAGGETSERKITDKGEKNGKGKRRRPSKHSLQRQT